MSPIESKLLSGNSDEITHEHFFQSCLNQGVRMRSNSLSKPYQTIYFKTAGLGHG